MMSSCSLRSPTFFRILSSIVSIGIFCAYIIQILDLTESCKGRNLLSSRDNECVSDLKYFTWTDPSDWILRDNIDGYNSWILQDLLIFSLRFLLKLFFTLFQVNTFDPHPCNTQKYRTDSHLYLLILPLLYIPTLYLYFNILLLF